jgi:hypothetical protein
LGLLAASHPEPDGLDQDRRAFLRETAEQMAQALVRRARKAGSPAGADYHPQPEEGRGDGSADAEISATAGQLARQTIAEIDHALSAIIGSVRMVELEAAYLPSAAVDHLQAIVGEARQISLISHKLSLIDRLLAGGDRGDKTDSTATVPSAAGDTSC